MTRIRNNHFVLIHLKRNNVGKGMMNLDTRKKMFCYCLQFYEKINSWRIHLPKIRKI